MAKLNAKQKRFVKEYLIDLNGTQAAIRAGYSPKTANEQAARLLANVSIQEAIQEEMKKREERTDITVDRVVQELHNIVTVNPNEIVELRRCCCRYCWGIENKYQFTPDEMRRAQERHAEKEKKARKNGEEILPFDPQGGIGYERNRQINPKCPECFGQGIEVPFFHDTRNLSPAAKSLYAGVKVTKDGIEVKMHSKDKMIELLGRHLGMFKDKLEVENKVTNPYEGLTKEQLLKLAREGDG